MPYFNPDYIQFFQDLAQHNNKEWFNENKKTYETEVKKPFEKLLGDLLDRMPELDEDIAMTPKEALFRINRDIRFSKDKTPYNVLMKAGLAKGGRKSPYPGFFLGISAEAVHVGGGAWMLEKDHLGQVRDHIKTNTQEFLDIVDNPLFQIKLGGIKGDQLKRVPPEYIETHAQTPLIANKQFYYM